MKYTLLLIAVTAAGAENANPECTDPTCSGKCVENPMHKDSQGNCVPMPERIVTVGKTFQEGKFPYLTREPIMTASALECKQRCLVTTGCNYGTFVSANQQSNSDYNHGRPAQFGECWLSETTHSTNVACGVDCVGFRKEVVKGDEKSKVPEASLGGACFVSPDSDQCCQDIGHCWNGLPIMRNDDMNDVTWCAFDYKKHCPPKPACKCNPVKHRSNFVKCHHDMWTNHIIVKHLEHRFHGAPIGDHQQHRCMTVSRNYDDAECACCDCNHETGINLPFGVQDLGTGQHLVGPDDSLISIAADTMNTCAQLCEQDRECQWGSFSAAARLCTLSKAEPAKDGHGHLVLKKCPQIYDGKNSIDCHAFMLHAHRAFHKSADLTLERGDEEVRPEWMKLGVADGKSNPNAKSQIRTDPNMKPGARPHQYAFCSWNSATRSCGSFNQDVHESHRPPVKKEDHQNDQYRYPFVERHLIPGMARDNCVQHMQLGHNVQWMCPPQKDYRPWGENYQAAEDQAHPYRVVKGVLDRVQCERPRACESDEVQYAGRAFSYSADKGYDALDNKMFGSGLDDTWVGGAGVSIGFAFEQPRALNKLEVTQYPRSCSRTAHGCCQDRTTVKQPDGTDVHDFCDDPAGDEAFKYCKVIHIEHSDDKKTWSRAGVFRAQVGLNTFKFIGDGMKHKYWQMACGDDDVTHWTLPAHRGIKLFEAVQGCSDDGLGSRHWHVNDRGFGQCVYGCGCYTGCNSITMVARQINTEAECNTQRANGIALKWDDVNHRCSYTEVEAEQRCRAAKDMFEQTRLQRPCGANERYNYQRCEPCPDGEFRELKSHFLPNCVKCSGSNKCGDFGPACRQACDVIPL